jgi:hypothetical protein
MMEEHRELVALLRQLTTAGLAEWAQSDEPGFVHCLLGDDLLTMELLGGADADHVHADDEVDGIKLNFRNIRYLFLTPTEDGQELLALVRQAPKDRERFYALYKTARKHQLDILRRLTENAKPAT